MSEIAERDFHAFPTSSVDGFTQHGMTLRDYFAGQALVGLLASPRTPGDERAPYTAGTYVKLSFALADAMLEGREA